MSEHHALNVPIESCSLSWEDVVHIYENLNECQQRAVELDEMKLPAPKDKLELEKYMAFKAKRYENFTIYITVSGAGGEAITGSDSSIFTSNYLPNEIVQVYFSNTAWFQALYKIDPDNKFSVSIDFSKPPIVDFSTPTAAPTPNNSFIDVSGSESDWVKSVVDAVQRVENINKNNRAWLHRPFIYDLLVLLVGFPVGLYFASNIERFVKNYFESSFVGFVLTLICFWITLVFLRASFSYTKWAFPKIELHSEKSRTSIHRRRWKFLLVCILTSMVMPYFFNFIKKIFLGP